MLAALGTGQKGVHAGAAKSGAAKSGAAKSGRFWSSNSRRAVGQGLADLAHLDELLVDGPQQRQARGQLRLCRVARTARAAPVLM